MLSELPFPLLCCFRASFSVTASMPSFLELTAQHPILCALARSLSTVNLFHLALTCHENHTFILASKQVFEILRRHCLCDGTGLKRRQNRTGLYPPRWSYNWGSKRKIWVDEPIEVQLWATKCDAANALPCRKCGINVCEVCPFKTLLSHTLYQTVC